MAAEPWAASGRPTAPWPARLPRQTSAACPARARTGAQAVSVDERTELREGEGTADSVAGFLAAAALFAGLLSLVWYPGRVGPAAMLVALIAAGMAGPNRRFTGLALAGIVACWLVGMVVAVITERPIL